MPDAPTAGTPEEAQFSPSGLGPIDAKLCPKMAYHLARVGFAEPLLLRHGRDPHELIGIPAHAARAASPTASLRVGCEWVQRAMSSALPWYSMIVTHSA